jgi:hypothetical protein
MRYESDGDDRYALPSPLAGNAVLFSFPVRQKSMRVTVNVSFSPVGGRDPICVDSRRSIQALPHSLLTLNSLTRTLPIILIYSSSPHPSTVRRYLSAPAEEPLLSIRNCLSSHSTHRAIGAGRKSPSSPTDRHANKSAELFPVCLGTLQLEVRLRLAHIMPTYIVPSPFPLLPCSGIARHITVPAFST